MFAFMVVVLIFAGKIIIVFRNTKAMPENYLLAFSYWLLTGFILPPRIIMFFSSVLFLL